MLGQTKVFNIMSVQDTCSIGMEFSSFPCARQLY